MNNDPDPAVPPAADDPALSSAVAGQRRRLRVAALLNSGALLATSALLAACEVKLPKAQGD